MKDNIWEIVYIVLGGILAVVIGLCMFEYNRTRVVDCERIEKRDMLPKQCKEGE